jgi:hypothetical protein
MLNGLFAEQAGRVQVDQHGLRPGIGKGNIIAFHIGTDGDTGIVDNGMQPAKFGQYVFKKLDHFYRFTQVGLEGSSAIADVVYHMLGGIGVTVVVNGYLGSGFRQLLGYGPANAPTGAGYQYFLS